MTTAAVMIADALAEIGVLGEGETPTGDMIDRGLRMLNRLLDTQAIFRSFDFTGTPQLTKALTGQTSFDIGPSGDLQTDRPIKIDSAVYTLGGIDYEVAVKTMDDYDVIPLKTSTGSIPEFVAYDGFSPDGNLYVYPVCSGGTLKLRVTTSVKRFANANDELSLPEGYEDAIMLALSVRSCPSYNLPVSPDTRLAAQNAMRVLKRNNRTIPKQQLPAAMVGGKVSSLAAIYKG